MDKEVDQRTEDKRDQSCYQGSDVTDFHLVGCQLYRGMTIGSKLVHVIYHFSQFRPEHCSSCHKTRAPTSLMRETPD